MRFKLAALFNALMFLWGTIMCIMNLVGYIEIPWFLATMPFYGGITILIFVCLGFYLISFAYSIIKRYKQGSCIMCGQNIKQNESKIQN